MPTYEINLWQEKKIVEKVVKQFQNDDEVIKYIADNFDRTEDLPRLDAEAGYLRPKKSDAIITWSKISTYVRKHAPKRMELTDEEKEIKDTLEKSITKEVINEWGYNEMVRQVEHYYWGQPEAKGQEDKK
tara:strand:- start:203 stop:592 length:390 start_codon:yes stop_codon:yes gene_type:complete